MFIDLIRYKWKYGLLVFLYFRIFYHDIFSIRSLIFISFFSYVQDYLRQRIAVLSKASIRNSIGWRGKDSFGYLEYEAFILAHSRLSIVDLSSNGNQPFKGEKGVLLVLFNKGNI